MRFKSDLLWLILPIVLVVSPFSASALTSATLETDSRTFTVGQRSAIDVWLNNEAEAKNFSAKIKFAFTAANLSWQNFEFSSAWLPLTMASEDNVNNLGGQALKTAGYPGGFAGRVKLGRIWFVPKTTGQAQISLINDSLVLNEQGENMFTGALPLNIKIVPAKAASGTGTIDVWQPETLVNQAALKVDGQLVLSPAPVSSDGQLSLKVSLPTFSTWPSKLQIVWRLRNESGTVVAEVTKDLSANSKTAEHQFDLAKLPKANYLAEADLVYDGQQQSIHTQSLVDWQAPARRRAMKLPSVNDIVNVSGGWLTMGMGTLLGILAGLIVFKILNRKNKQLKLSKNKK